MRTAGQILAEYVKAETDEERRYLAQDLHDATERQLKSMAPPGTKITVSFQTRNEPATNPQ